MQTGLERLTSLESFEERCRKLARDKAEREAEFPNGVEPFGWDLEPTYDWKDA